MKAKYNTHLLDQFINSHIDKWKDDIREKFGDDIINIDVCVYPRQQPFIALVCSNGKVYRVTIEYDRVIVELMQVDGDCIEYEDPVLK